MMKIRKVTLNDAEALLQIYKPYILNTPITFETAVPPLEEFQKRVMDISATFPWLVAETDQQIVGYTYATTFKARQAYQWSVESTLYIDQNHHRQGLGRKLYKALFQELQTMGVINIVGVIALPNTPSVSLHESFGFTPAAHFKNIGFKLNQWWDVGYWQLQLTPPPKTPKNLNPPRP